MSEESSSTFLADQSHQIAHPLALLFEEYFKKKGLTEKQIRKLVRKRHELKEAVKPAAFKALDDFLK